MGADVEHAGWSGDAKRHAARRPGRGRRVAGTARWRAALVVVAVLVVSVVCLTAYAAAVGAIPSWVWLPVAGASLAAIAVLLRLGTRPLRAQMPRSGPDYVAADTTGAEAPGSRLALATPVVTRDAELPGLHLAVGCRADEAAQVAMCVSALSDDTSGLVVLGCDAAVDEDAVKVALREAFAAAATPQQAGTALLGRLDAELSPACALVGVWQWAQRRLTYFAAGLEPPAVFNVGWPHLSEPPIDRQTRRGPQKVTFGRHRLSPSERWLLYTRPLIDVPDPQAQPFNVVGIVQYAHDDRGMPQPSWMNYLLQLALRAHNDSLPPGSVLISLIHAAAAPADRQVELGQYRSETSAPGQRRDAPATGPRSPAAGRGQDRTCQSPPAGNVDPPMGA